MAMKPTPAVCRSASPGAWSPSCRPRGVLGRILNGIQVWGAGRTALRSAEKRRGVLWRESSVALPGTNCGRATLITTYSPGLDSC